MTRVLVTNDDGVSSPGVAALARALAMVGHDVVVVAPDHDASGTGASLGRIASDTAIAVTPSSIAGFSGEVFGLAGPPAMCVVVAANGAFGKPPELVVSGINAGLNTGRSTLHSGTVGAALAAQNFGLRGLAVSQDQPAEGHWQTAAVIAAEISVAIMDAPSRVAVSLNVPGVSAHQVRGTRWAALAEFGSVRTQVVDFSDNEIHVDMLRTDYEPPPDSDLGLVRSGYVAVTSMHAGVEVWGGNVRPGDDFDPEVIPGASRGDVLSVPRHVLANS
ncbi:MAG: 5'/3'-nucleotidase SurE [Gammaproteobacteria bacterium]|nr:5'/3'-nucleotidase SurE [Gammaproteobacteria bacterium]RPG24280.1 MAG: 5'/3'-nucleotidase SurE [Gammaproteobacteria bacterium TMED50]